MVGVLLHSLNPEPSLATLWRFRMRSAIIFTNMQRERQEKRCFCFQDSWKYKYLFVPHGRNVQCLVCKKTLTAMRADVLGRHYNKLHQATHEQYTGDARRAVIAELEQTVEPVASIDTRHGPNARYAALFASYEIALNLAKAKKCFSDGPFIKKCAIQMVQAFGRDESAAELKTVPLSRNTICSRTADIAAYVADKLYHIVTNCRFYSLCLDESTDRTDTSQLLIFIRTVSDDFQVHEECLGLSCLHNTTKGADIFHALKLQVDAIGGFDKCVSITTDGAPAMVGNDAGLVGHLKKNNINCLTFHCLIHQEVLCAKFLKLSATMKLVTKVTNFIRGGNRSLTHRKFKNFLDEVNAAYSDLRMHTEVRWLSAGNCLQRFFSLRKEVPLFLQQYKPDDVEMRKTLQSKDFQQDLAFLTDFTRHMNALNVQLQGKNKEISQLVSCINGFRAQLSLFCRQLQQENLVHFPCCSELLQEFPEMKFSSRAIFVQDVLNEFQRRFESFDALKSDLDVFHNPFNVKVDDQPVHLQLELCNLQNDLFLRSRQETGIQFHKLLDATAYPNIRTLALKVHAMFGSTYLCENAFSTLKYIKNSHRTALTDENLRDLLRLATTDLTIDISQLVNATMSARCQTSIQVPDSDSD